MFLRNSKSIRKEQNINDVHMSEIVELEIDKKSLYFKSIAEGISMIELEKEMQSRLDLLM